MPKRCSRDGGAKKLVEVERRRRVGREERAPSVAATTSSATTTIAATAAAGRRSRRRSTESARGAVGASSGGRRRPCSRDRLRPQARVDDAENDVDDQARDDEGGDREQDERLQHAVVALVDRVDQRASPSPGLAKTYSTITAPPTRWATMIPAAVIAGIEAFGSSCRTTTWRRRSPLPFAVRTNDDEPTSSKRRRAGSASSPRRPRSRA